MGGPFAFVHNFRMTPGNQNRNNVTLYNLYTWYYFTENFCSESSGKPRSVIM